MTSQTLPSSRRLWGCWALLMGMTVLSLWAADPSEAVRRLPLSAVAVMLAAAGVKSSQILWVFLDLRRSTATWKGTFLAGLVFLLLLLLGAAGLGLVLVH